MGNCPLPKREYKLKLNSTAILNGCNTKDFFPINNIKFKNNKIRLITHHWSNNYLKGFHIYNKLDKLLNNRNDIEFTYIGNYNYQSLDTPAIKISHLKNKIGYYDTENILKEQKTFLIIL